MHIMENAIYCRGFVETYAMLMVWVNGSAEVSWATCFKWNQTNCSTSTFFKQFRGGRWAGMPSKLFEGKQNYNNQSWRVSVKQMSINFFFYLWFSINNDIKFSTCDSFQSILCLHFVLTISVYFQQ